MELFAESESFLDRNSWITGVVVPVLVGIAVLAIERYWHSREKSTKTFDYRVLSDVPILSHRPDDNLLKVTYMDEELAYPRLVRVRLANTGNQVIRPSEILEDYVVTVGARVVSMMVAEQSARILDTFELTAPNFPACEVRLPLATMNPGDYVVLQMLVDSEESPDINVAGRIEGQTRETSVQLTQEQALEVKALVGLAFVSLFVFCGLGLSIVVTGPSSIAARSIGALSIVTGIGFFIAILKSAASSKRQLQENSSD